MYIHSQNKKTIVNSDNVTNIYAKYSKAIIGDGKKYNDEKGQTNVVEVSKKKSDRNYYYLYCTTVSGEDIKLGQYSSIERCEEILNEILNDLKMENPIYVMPGDSYITLYEL